MQREIQEAWDKISPSIMGQEDYDKTKAFKDFLNSYKSEIILDDFIEMINKASFKFEWSKVEIIQEFLKSPGSPAMTRHNVIEIIDKTGIENDGFKGKIIQDFIKSPKSSTNFDDVVNIIKETDIRFDVVKENIILEFLKSSKSSPETTSSQIIEMINEAGIKDDYVKRNIILVGFLKSPKSPKSPKTTSSQIIEMIKETGIKNDHVKGNIILEFLKSPKSSPETTSSQIIEMINGAGIKNDRVKEDIILKFLKSLKSPPETTSSQIIEMINGAGIKNDRVKGDIILEFLHSPKSSPEANSSQIIEMINEAGIKDDGEKGNIILEFLRSPKSLAITPKDLANMIKVVGLQNRADLSTILYANKFPSSQNYIENFIDFTKVLHQSEAMQCEFVKEFIDKNRINRDNVKGLKPFIEGLQDNDLALVLIENLNSKRIIVDEKDTLSLVKNRSKKQYAFLTEVVSEKSLGECISLEGIETLKATFGNDLKVGDQSITVSDLISYYDLKGETSSLSAMLKPEFKQQLRDNFAPSAQMLLYKPTELEKLNSLLSEEGVAFDVKSYFVENTTLCDYLNKKVGNVKEIDPSTIYNINFANFGIEEEKKAGINTLFNELLKSYNPNEAGVAKFFSDLLGITLSDDDSKKLKIFFKQNKKELAHCFCDEELPKENFESLFTTLRDGCFANIGTQFTSMLYGAMIKDGDAEVLYGVMSSKIIAPIGASQDITHHGQSLDNAIIKSYYVSPSALIEQLSKEEMLNNKKSWEIIGKNLGDDYELIDRLGKAYTETLEFNQKAKEIASYLIVKNVVGEEKMKDLENKNPQLKKLGDSVCRSPEPSPRSTRGASPEELSGPSPNRSRT